MDSTVSHVLLDSIVLKVAIPSMKLESLVTNLKNRAFINSTYSISQMKIATRLHGSLQKYADFLLFLCLVISIRNLIQNNKNNYRGFAESLAPRQH